MALQFVYIEDVDNISPQGAGFSYKDGHATSRYEVTKSTPAGAKVGGNGTGPASLSPSQLATAVTEILGNVTINGAGLSRKLPLCHPVYQWLYASAINEIKGVGPISWSTVPNNKFLSAPPISNQWGTYATWYFTISFTPRPYAVLPDSYISTLTRQWYPATTFDPSGVTGVSGNNPIMYNSPNEWTRFVDWEPHAKPDSVAANQGQMYFAQPNLLGNAQAPVFPAMPRMFLNNQQVNLTWYQVPISYITSPNSYIKKFRGRINQFQWYNWNAGELLYQNYEIIRYTPPVQQLQIVGLNDPGQPKIQVQFDQQKYVDIRFDFLETVRATNDNFEPVNKNSIVAGHNLLPIAQDRNYFHYAYLPNKLAPASPALGFAAGAVNQAYWQPAWCSFDFPLLFVNPDAPQPTMQVL